MLVGMAGGRYHLCVCILAKDTAAEGKTGRRRS